jgi:hypothetical protein
MGSNGYVMVDGIQRIYDGGWDPSAQIDNSKPEQVKHCMDLDHHCLHWLRLEPTQSYSPWHRHDQW